MIKMIRPKYLDVIANVTGSLQCSCGSRLDTFQETREHWQMGHFDYPDDTLFRAAAKFVSENMLKRLSDFPDDTPLRLGVDGRSGYMLTLKLGDLRALAAEIIHDWP